MNELEKRLETEKSAKNKPGRLESMLDELNDLVNLSIGVSFPAAGFLLTGNPGVAVTSLAYAAATNDKGAKSVRNEFASGAVFGTFAHYFLSPIKYLGGLAKAAYMSVFPLAGQAVYLAEDHIIKQKSAKGLYSKFKEKYVDNVKRAFKYAFPINLAAAFFVPSYLMVTVTAATAYIMRKYIVSNPK